MDTNAGDEPEDQVYVKRNKAGDIVSVSLVADEAHSDSVRKDAPEVRAFADQLGTASSLAQSDTDMSRVVEDLIDVLIQKDIMFFTDLPEAAQAKLLKRQKMRMSMAGQLLSDDERLI